MKNKADHSAAPPLKNWTKKNLRESDYVFARSENGGDCLATRLWKFGSSSDKRPWHLIVEMIDWEMFRELDLPACPECKRKPYLEIPDNRTKVDTVLQGNLPTRIIPQLEEIKLADAPAWLQAHGGMDDGTSLHAFEIQRYDDTDGTVARFRKWLVGFKKTPDRLQWRADMKQSFARRGALRYDADLRALAVRRLKLAGYNREEAESLLGLKKYALNPRLKVNVSKRQEGDQAIGSGTDQWIKSPAIAERDIRKFYQKLSRIYFSTP